MIAQELLDARRAQLRTGVLESLRDLDDSTLHIVAFAARVLGVQTITTLAPSFQFRLAQNPGDVRYAGFPQVAYIGFGLALGAFAAGQAAQEFLVGIQTLRRLPAGRVRSFAGDDIALLGAAEGLAALDPADISDYEEIRSWMLSLVEQSIQSSQWSSRMRSLAGDILEGRGRLRQSPSSEVDVLATEYALRPIYPKPFAQTITPGEQDTRMLLQALITGTLPSSGELDRLVVWFAALENILDLATSSLMPSVSDTVRLLERIQTSLKRWPWTEKQRRKNTAPTRWEIDNEYDVQSLLWTVLYPVYGNNLVDEEYLRTWGNVQARIDLGILNLKLIIEVKHARDPGSFKDIEEQVAGDLGLYFKDTSLFDRMVVFVYDDSDNPQPERYALLKSALLGRERIEAVVVVQRPSMIPKRGSRGISSPVNESSGETLAEEDGDE